MPQGPVSEMFFFQGSIDVRSDTHCVARNRRFLPPRLMNRLNHCHNENLALRPRVMDDMLTLTEAPLVGVHPTAPDNQVHAEILTRCFVSRYVVLYLPRECAKLKRT